MKMLGQAETSGLMSNCVNVWNITVTVDAEQLRQNKANLHNTTKYLSIAKFLWQ